MLSPCHAAKSHPLAPQDALESLLHWHSMAKRAEWRHLIDVRADFRTPMPSTADIQL
jgi:hypothetical protein